MTLFKDPSQLKERSGNVQRVDINDWLKIFGYRQLQCQTARIWLAVLESFSEVGIPQTVRQIYYQMLVKDIFSKTEGNYAKTVYHLKNMREKRLFPYSWIADYTRLMRKPPSHNSLHSCLQITKETYRRSLWAEQQEYVEIWCEKEALTGVINGVTEEYDVPLMVTKGFSSLSFIHSAAEYMKGIKKEIIIYYLGDFDPSGISARNDVRNKFLSFNVYPTFKPVAVLPRQIREWKLPTRPTKKSDSRAKSWNGPSVELDAIPANRLRNLVRNSIEQHIDRRVLEETRRIEALERETFENMISSFRSGFD